MRVIFSTQLVMATGDYSVILPSAASVVASVYIYNSIKRSSLPGLFETVKCTIRD